MDLWSLYRWIHLYAAPCHWEQGFGVVGSIWMLHPSQGLVFLDCWIHLDPAPLTRIRGSWMVGSIWILHSSRGFVVPGSVDPPGSCTLHKDLWPLDRRIHLEPAPLTRICGPWMVGSIWILHPSQ